MSGVPARAFVGLGGNVGDRINILRSAVRQLENGHVADTWLACVSPVYETRAVGPSNDPFLNAIAEVRTRLSPRALLDALVGIEDQHGRVRTQRWGARTLDLDLVLWLHWTPAGFAPLRHSHEGVELPHPRMSERDFVLEPLADLLGNAPIHADRSAHALRLGLRPADRTILGRWPDGLRAPPAAG